MVTDYNSREFILGFTCTRSSGDTKSSRKFYRKNDSCISENLASIAVENIKHIKDPSLLRATMSDESIITECLICSEMAILICFKPCGHKIVCADCGLRMKKCLKCKETIESRVTPVALASTMELHASTNALVKQQRPTSSADARRRERDLEERLLGYEEQYTCTICMERPKTIVFLCGHGACAVCVETLRSCHMCRVPILQKINLY